MKQLLKKNSFFLIPYVIVLTICAVLLLSFSKPELHIFSNQHNSPFFDVFFKIITNLGDGAMIAVLTVVLLFIRYRYAIIFLSGSLITAATINFIKRVALGDVFRPSKYFEVYETYKLHFVDGVHLHALHSFPSGHTGTAFNVFFMLALISPSKWLKLFWFFMAALVAYSRVYLSQHFLIDVTAGSVFGTVILLLVFLWMMKWKKPWLDTSLIRKQ